MTWAELLDEIYTLTKRSDLVAETGVALRNAVRMAHKSGKFWRDLAQVTINNLALDTVQEVDIPTYLPRLKQVAYIRSTANNDLQLKEVRIDDLLDEDNYARTNVYWGLGTKLKIRAYAAEASYQVAYWRYPVVSPSTAFDSWIAEDHSDALILPAATTVLQMIGENEIRAKLEPLAAQAMRDLIEDNLEMQGR